MKDLLTEKIAGCLIGAAYGDALGAPTENRTREQIYEKWGYVDRLLDAPPDVYARGNKAGQITDDFSMAYVTIQEILEKQGEIDSQVAKSALLKWAENERFFEQGNILIFYVGQRQKTGNILNRSMIISGHQMAER